MFRTITSGDLMIAAFELFLTNVGNDEGIEGYF